MVVRKIVICKVTCLKVKIFLQQYFSLKSRPCRGEIESGINSGILVMCDGIFNCSRAYYRLVLFCHKHKT